MNEFYICRDGEISNRDYNYYAIYTDEPPSRGLNFLSGSWMDADIYICNDKIHQTGLHLNKGEGPVKVKIDIIRI